MQIRCLGKQAGRLRETSVQEELHQGLLSAALTRGELNRIGTVSTVTLINPKGSLGQEGPAELFWEAVGLALGPAWTSCWRWAASRPRVEPQARQLPIAECSFPGETQL